MNKITKILGATALVMSVATTPVLSDSSDFAGGYIGVQFSAIGVELDGSAASAADDTGETTTGTVGKTAMIAGAEVGYAFPVSDSALIDIGVNYVDGSAMLKTTNTDTTATADVTFEVTDLVTAYIAPTWAISDSASVYIKIGYTESSVTVSGDVSKPGDLKGETLAIGSRSLFGNGMFMRTEAGITEFDTISSKGLGAGGTGKNVATTTTVTADPTIAFGAITIGYKF